MYGSQTAAGREIAAHPLAYDQVTGFGLVLPLQNLNAPAVSFGSSAELRAGSEVHVLSAKEFGSPQSARVLARREFAGAWEYLLEEAIFTAPAHPHWSGAALIDDHGGLVGLGSLLVREVIAGEEINANMFLPIDLLKPILQSLKSTGRVDRQPRPWLGSVRSRIGREGVRHGRGGRRTCANRRYSRGRRHQRGGASRSRHTSGFLSAGLGGGAGRQRRAFTAMRGATQYT